MQNKIDLEFIHIPGSDFIMGSDLSEDSHSQPDETPLHTLHITDFYIMRYPVTNAQYQQFVEATGHRPARFWPDGQYPADKADHPVVGVSFNDAVAFSVWAAGETGLPIRLPTEPEWEKSSRGKDGNIYPWGNTWESGRCNNRKEKHNTTTPVSQYSPQGDSPYGVGDMGGNVQEWCLSLFGKYPYDPNDGREILVENMDPDRLVPGLHETGCVANPLQIEAALDKSVIRGGSWRETQIESRGAYRSWAAPMHRSPDTGFRCCYDKE